MDFQEAFLEMYWEPWAWLLGLFVGAVIVLAMYYMLTRSTSLRSVGRRARKAYWYGQGEEV